MGTKVTVTYSIDEYFSGRVIAYLNIKTKQGWFTTPLEECQVIYNGYSLPAAEKVIANQIIETNSNKVENSKAYDSRGNRIFADQGYM